MVDQADFAAALVALSVAELAGQRQLVVAGPPSGEPWTEAHAAIADEAALAERMRRIEGLAGVELPALAAAWYVERHAWYAGTLAVGLALVGGVVPSLDPRTTWIACDGFGLPLGIAAAPDGAWRAVADGSEAAGRAVERLEAHLEPVIAAFAPHRREEALWREAGDRVASAVLWLGDALGRRDEAWRLGHELLALPSRLRVEPGFRLEQCDEGERSIRTRVSCCLGHRSPHLDWCEHCPKVATLPGGPC